jgi:hypothetical protein
VHLSAPGEPGLLSGVVTHQEYYGHDAVVRVRLTEETTVGESTVGESNAELVVRTDGYEVPSVGEAVSLEVKGDVLAVRAVDGGLVGS